MTILKTYARMFVSSLDESLPFLELLVGRPADPRSAFGKSELAAIGDLLVIAGPAEETEQYREVTGPFVISDMDEVEALLKQNGAVITQPRQEVPTGISLWATHAAGTGRANYTAARKGFGITTVLTGEPRRTPVLSSAGNKATETVRWARRLVSRNRT